MGDDLTPSSNRALRQRISEHTKVMLPVGVIIAACAWVVGYWINSYDARIMHNAVALEAERNSGIERDKRIQALEINAGYAQQSLRAIEKTTESINEKVEKLSNKIDDLKVRP